MQDYVHLKFLAERVFVMILKIILMTENIRDMLKKIYAYPYALIE